MTTAVGVGDCVEWARAYRGEPFHAMLCDPPYHLTSIVKRFGGENSAPAKHGKDGAYTRASRGFMGKQWDGGELAFMPDTWATLASVLHPGAFIMAFAGTRGYHRMACAMEDAGLIIHPALGWGFGSGFPKATRIDTQIDKAAGAVREETKARWAGRRTSKFGSGQGDITYGDYDIGDIDTLPATHLAAAWQGHRYGLQALKPAFEFIAVAQVPYSGRAVDSITKTGAGALNVDGARIGAAKNKNPKPTRRVNSKPSFTTRSDTNLGGDDTLGRWPANLILSHSPGCNGECAPDCAVKMLGEQSGELQSGGKAGKQYHYEKDYEAIVPYAKMNQTGVLHADTGTAARFFFNSDYTLEKLEDADPLMYCAKAGRRERDAGLPDGERNPHPTVKPIKLVRHLATLLLPPAEYAPRRLFVPFSGAGSEMIGAMLAGWDVVQGVEMESEYADIARARLHHWAGNFAEVKE